MRRIPLVFLVALLAIPAVQVSAQSQDPLISSARQFSQQGNHDTAIVMLRSGLAARPNDQALKNELADVLTLKQFALSEQLAELRREIAALRGLSGSRASILGGTGIRGTAPATGSISGVSAGIPGTAPVRVGGAIGQPMKVRDVKPIYPVEAQAIRLQGIVIIEATIDPEGNVADAKVLRGQPLLNEAAVEAVRQWAYTPTLLNGVPVPVIMTVTVTFTLQE